MINFYVINKFERCVQKATNSCTALHALPAYNTGKVLLTAIASWIHRRLWQCYDEVTLTNRTDAWKTNVRFHSLIHCINYKVICLPTYWQWKLTNEHARISVIIIKNLIEYLGLNGTWSNGIKPHSISTPLCCKWSKRSTKDNNYY